METRPLFIRNTPHYQCMELRRDSVYAIDDLITGSYHYSSLESLASGCILLNYLDPRTEDVMNLIAQVDYLPLMNVEFSSLYHSLKELLDNKHSDQRKVSVEWIKNHWSSKSLM